LDIQQHGAATRDQARKYWHVIHWDATRFITGQRDSSSRLLHDTINRSLTEDSWRLLRSLVVGLARTLLELSVSLLRGRSPDPSPRQPYVLLLSAGGPKYAYEERQVIEACGRKALAVRTAYPAGRSGVSPDWGALTTGSILTSADRARAVCNWLLETVHRLPWFFGRDTKQRSLFVAVIPDIRRYYLDVAFAHRIVAKMGAPRFVFSLLPSLASSVAVVEQMKRLAVLTASIRTQTTSKDIEHLVINTDILFCKSPHEVRTYREILGGEGPRLKEGCLLSLPEEYRFNPLPLPGEYVLLLGTDAAVTVGTDDYRRFNEKLFQLGAAARLPVVFKGHNLAKDLDEAWFSDRPAGTADCVRIVDIRRNRELIDRASLVVSTDSTLLYYAILRGKPVILVDTGTSSAAVEEFQTAPVRRITWQDTVEPDDLDWNALHESSRAAKSWLQENYYLQRGVDHMVDLLLGGGR
jgi:hypothetical protein